MRLFFVGTFLAVLAASTTIASAQTATMSTPEQQITQRLSHFEDTVLQAERGGAISEKQAASDKRKIVDIHNSIIKHKMHHRNQVTLKGQANVNKMLDKAEDKERRQESDTAAHKNKKKK